jgi:hypothetical protein
VARINIGRIDTALGSCVALVLIACGGDFSTPAAQGQLAVPSRSLFPPVADAMELRCGTLDCHGQVGRNLRLYGQYGLRLSPADNPLGQPTTDAEYDACYLSIIGLEPEAMSNVVQHQAPLETLTLIRKPRGLEQHKGGELTYEGEPLDSCITGWLLGAFDADACSTVVQMQRPEPPKPGLDAGD